MGVLLVLFGVAGLLFVSAILRGYVLSTLWGWFIVPAFGAPDISIPVACGISLIAAMLAMQTNGDKDKSKDATEALGRAALNALVMPLISLLFGRIILAFM